MKKLILYALPIAALVSLPAHGQDVGVRTAVLAYSWDLDGEAADDDQIVTSTDLADSTTFVIAAQPDSCRLVDMTITDANSSTTAGTVTFTGTDCLGYPRVCVFDFAVVATRGSGVKTLPVTVGPTGSSCYLRDVTSVVSNAFTGEEGGGTDLIKAGYTTNSADAWTMYGIPGPTDPLGRHSVDPWNSSDVPLNITTAGVSTTAVTSVSSNAAFTNVAAGDLLLIKIGSHEYMRKVVTRSSADAITVNQALNIPAAGVPFRFKKFYYSTDPYDNLWIPVGGSRAVAFEWAIAANADTGGVISTVQCTDTAGPDWPIGSWVTVGPGGTGAVTTASGSAQVPTVFSVDLTLAPFTYCRFANRFGTGDDGDGANEDISVKVTLVK